MIDKRPISNLTGAARDILALMPDIEPGWGMGLEIARTLNIDRHYVCKILRQLAADGYIEQTTTGIYRLKPDHTITARIADMRGTLAGGPG